MWHHNLTWLERPTISFSKNFIVFDYQTPAKNTDYLQFLESIYVYTHISLINKKKIKKKEKKKKKKKNIYIYMTVYILLCMATIPHGDTFPPFEVRHLKIDIRSKQNGCAHRSRWIEYSMKIIVLLAPTCFS